MLFTARGKEQFFNLLVRHAGFLCRPQVCPSFIYSLSKDLFQQDSNVSA